MPYYNLFNIKRIVEKEGDYTDFNNIVDDDDELFERKSSFYITSNRICNRNTKCNRNTICNLNREKVLKQIDFIIDSLINIITHIFFISIFEPLFYLNYVVKLEYEYIMDKISDEIRLLHIEYMKYSISTRCYR